MVKRQSNNRQIENRWPEHENERLFVCACVCLCICVYVSACVIRIDWRNKSKILQQNIFSWNHWCLFRRTAYVDKSVKYSINEIVNKKFAEGLMIRTQYKRLGVVLRCVAHQIKLIRQHLAYDSRAIFTLLNTRYITKRNKNDVDARNFHNNPTKYGKYVVEMCFFFHVKMKGKKILWPVFEYNALTEKLTKSQQALDFFFFLVRFKRWWFSHTKCSLF